MVVTVGFSQKKLYEWGGILKNGGSQEIKKGKIKQSKERYRSDKRNIEVIEVYQQ